MIADARHEFSAKSSAEDTTYRVVFKIKNNWLTIQCDCKAGTIGQSCKHKLELLTGKVARLADPSESQRLLALSKFLASTKMLQFHNSFRSESDKLDREIELLKAKKVQLKKQFEAGLREGIEL